MHIVIYSQFKLKFCYDLVNWHFSFIVKLNIVFPTAAGHQHAGYVWEVQHPVRPQRTSAQRTGWSRMESLNSTLSEKLLNKDYTTTLSDQVLNVYFKYKPVIYSVTRFPVVDHGQECKGQWVKMLSRDSIQQ